MLILSLDSAGSGCSACVWRDGNVIALAEEHMERGQDQRLMPLVLGVIEQARVAFENLDRVAVTRGPGSFTGLRIGLAAARGIGLAANKPVIGIDRFAIYRRQFKATGGNLFVALNSKRKELFCRFYPAGGAAQEPIMLTPDEMWLFLENKGETTVTSDMTFQGAVHSEKLPGPEVITCAALAAAANPDDPAFLPRPLYLRAPDVTFAHKAQKEELRTISAEDAPLLVALHAECFGDNAWNLGQIKGSLAQETTYGWIAFHKGEPAGFILCQMPEESEILTFCVKPLLRRRGIGEKLIKQAIHSARKNRAPVFLEVAADNRAAIKLYEKQGFSENGRRKDYYRRGAVTIDAVLFVLPATKD